MRRYAKGHAEDFVILLAQGHVQVMPALLIVQVVQDLVAVVVDVQVLVEEIVQVAQVVAILHVLLLVLIHAMLIIVALHARQLVPTIVQVGAKENAQVARMIVPVAVVQVAQVVQDHARISAVDAVVPVTIIAPVPVHLIVVILATMIVAPLVMVRCLP